MRSLTAACGTQFGHVNRARHSNTSWDVARFEVCAHRYVAISEPTFGVALMADGPRGYDIRGDALRLTVLRSPRFPDPQADLGHQHLEWSVLLTPGDPLAHNIEHTAAVMAHPIRIFDGVPQLQSTHISLDAPGAMISAVKPADDGSDDVIVRVWESRGGRTHGSLHIMGNSATLCDALENPSDHQLLPNGDDSFALTLQPFEIATVRVTRQ
jgi:alpha-mannosidase